MMTPLAFSGFTSDCIFEAPYFVFENINGSQMSHIPPRAFVGLQEQQARLISNAAWTGATAQQLVYLSWEAFEEISASNLKTIVNNNRLELVNNLTVVQTYMYPLEAAAGNLSQI